MHVFNMNGLINRLAGLGLLGITLLPLTGCEREEEIKPAVVQYNSDLPATRLDGSVGRGEQSRENYKIEHQQ